MAAANPIVLLSSPLPAVLERAPPPKPCAAMSSSPGLPSPSKFFSQKVSRLGSGTTEGPIPKDAVAGLTGASISLRQSQSNYLSKHAASPEEDVLSELGLGKGNSDRSDQKKRKTKTAEEIDADAPKQQRAPAKRSSVVKKPIADIVSVATIEPSPARILKKTSSTKVKEPAQTKIKKGKVTKAAGTNPGPKDSKKGRSTKAGDGVAFQKDLEPSAESDEGNKVGENVAETPLQESEKAPLEDRSLPLGLEEATRRRKDWTPVKNTHEGFVALESVEGKPVGGQVTAAGKSLISQFGSLLGDYGYAQAMSETTSKPEITRSSSGEALTKRRKVEVSGIVLLREPLLTNKQLVTTSFGPSPEIAKLKRSKSPKKKPQTVTAKATAPFIPIEDLPTNSLLDYLKPRSGPELEGKIANKESTEEPKRARKKAPAESKVAKMKTPKAARRASLLPPEAALEKAKHQDLLFGTSSQLARDESPTFVRELQQAIKESELAEVTPAGGLKGGLAASTASGSSDGSSLSLFTASRNLWSVAARDLEGELQEAEVVDLLVTPKTQVSTKTAAPAADAIRPAPQVPKEVLTANNPPKPKQGWTDIEDEPDQALVQDTGISDLPLASREATVDAEQSIPRSLAEASLRERPKSRSPVKKAKAPKQPKESKQPKEAPAKDRPQCMPNYQGFTTAQLNKEITLYGFKAVKKRDDQIALLERCWESKNRSALQSLPPNVNLPQPSANADVTPELPKHDSPVKRRGRPPKAKAPAASKESEDPVDNDNLAPKPKGRPLKAKTPSIPEKSDGLIDKHLPPKREPRPMKATMATISPNKTGKASVPAKHKSTPPPSGEILDSDSTPRVSPSRHRASTPSAPALLDLSSSADITLTPLDRAALLDKITEAITTYPPTHNMTNLSWYEKILMYEPIVLEDLAMWLNLEGLARVDVDDEVSPGMVKDWCEGRSVCCLWRENLRGGTRARH